MSKTKNNAMYDMVNAIREEQNQEPKKPKVKLTGQDGNVFVLLGVCSRALKSIGQADKAKEMSEKVFASGSYHEALGIMGEYCEIR